VRSEEREPYLPTGYRLDRGDPDVWVLRRTGGRVIARFSAWGAAVEAIEKAAWDDHHAGYGSTRRKGAPVVCSQLPETSNNSVTCVRCAHRKRQNCPFCRLSSPAGETNSTPRLSHCVRIREATREAKALRSAHARPHAGLRAGPSEPSTWVRTDRPPPSGSAARPGRFELLGWTRRQG